MASNEDFSQWWKKGTDAINSKPGRKRTKSENVLNKEQKLFANGDLKTENVENLDQSFNK